MGPRRARSETLQAEEWGTGGEVSPSERNFYLRLLAKLSIYPNWIVEASRGGVKEGE